MVTTKSNAMTALRVLLCVVLFAVGCTDRKKPKRKELLVYCGITMIKPMAEIAKIIEEQEDCRIIITKDGSGNLLKAIRINGVGDLYLPGSESYITTARKEGLVTDTVLVGYNKAAMMVQKGNPKQISPDMLNLATTQYYVVIGNPDSGSIGRETKAILERRGIFEDVIANARELTTDSKRLVTVLKDKDADVVVNWYATAFWDGNEPHIDVIPIDEKYARKKTLLLGLLKSSKYPDIARRFMEYAASDEGRALFTKYGLYEVR
jgi:molybdate transport system substrate-binding protein